jgi:glycine dehydrogenase subunit 1
MATVYLSCLGKEGLRELAVLNLNKTEYAKKVVSRIRGCELNFAGPTFNEFVLKIEKEPGEVLEKLKREKILGGFPLAGYYPELGHHLLVTVTEINRKEEINHWAEALEKSLKF